MGVLLCFCASAPWSTTPGGLAVGLGPAHPCPFPSPRITCLGSFVAAWLGW